MPALRSRGGVPADVQAFTKDWHRLRAQKWRMRGGVEARMLLNLAMRFGEQYAQQARDAVFARPIDKDNDKNKLSLVFNLLKKQRNRKIGRLWSINNQFRASPDVTADPKALDLSDVVNRLMKGLNKKVGENLQQWRRLSWLVDTGVVIEHIPFIEEATEETVPAYDDNGELLWRDNANQDPNAVLAHSRVIQLVQQGVTPERFAVVEHLQTVGEVGSEIVSGLQFFIDAATPTIKQMGSDQGCYILYVKTVDWVRDQFGSDAANDVSHGAGTDLSIVKTRLLDKGPSVANLNMRDLIPAISNSQAPDDPPMCLFACRYQPSNNQYPHGRRTLFQPNGALFDDDEIPYGEVPLVDIHYEAPTVSFWTGDFVTDLIAPQKFLNKRLSQMGESANASIYEVLLLAGDLQAGDIPSDMPGVVEDGIAEDGTPRVRPLQRGELPQWFVESIKMSVDLMMSLGSSDLMDKRQFPGQLRGPMALPMLQEILDSEDGPLFSHMAEQMAQIHQQRVNRVRDFYPGIRTLHYTGTNRKDEVLVFHTDQVLRSGVSFTISVDPGSLLPEFSALKEARIIERLSGPLSGLYTDPRTGKIDYSRIAFELRYTDSFDEDRQSQYRTLAKHLIQRLWDGEQLPPEVPYAFWDHRVMLDELEEAMITTEWLEASAPVKQAFIDYYERCRQNLAAIQDAQMQSVQNSMMQGALAQATQFTAAKVAAETTDAALAQINAQAGMAESQPPVQQVAQAVAHNANGSQGRLM